MNCITWIKPPQTDEELQIWKVFITVERERVWDIIKGWLKKYGNPFVCEDDEHYDIKARRILYQLALTHCIK